MATIRVKDNPSHEIIEDNDIFFVTDSVADIDSKCTGGDIKKYVLNEKTVGGTGAGDIVNIDSSQTLTNKKLIEPKINSDNKIQATSDEINKLHNANITTAELNTLHSVADKLTALSDVQTTQTIQAQINALKTIIEAQNIIIYNSIIKATSNSIVLDSDDILTALNIDPEKYYIVVSSISPNITIVDKIAGKYTHYYDCPIEYYEIYDPVLDKNIFYKITFSGLNVDTFYDIKIIFKLGLR